MADQFRARVKEACVERGWSQNRLADFAGLSRSHVSEILRGNGVPTLTTVEKIANALELDGCKLLCGQKEELSSA